MQFPNNVNLLNLRSTSLKYIYIALDDFKSKVNFPQVYICSLDDFKSKVNFPQVYICSLR